MIRLHGKFGDTSGIVCYKGVNGKCIFLVEFDKEDPNDLTKAVLVKQLA